MKLKVPKKIRQEARSLLQCTTLPSAIEVSRVVGKVNAMSQGIPPAPLEQCNGESLLVHQPDVVIESAEAGEQHRE